MFETFIDNSKPTPAQLQAKEWKELQERATSAELLQAAKVRGLSLTTPESSRSCFTCTHWAFLSTDPESAEDRRCHKLPPVPDEDGEGIWPRTTDIDFCDSHRPVQTSAHADRGEAERRRLLMLFHKKLAAERKATAGKGRKRSSQ